MQQTPDKEKQDGISRGFHGIPDDEKLKKMSFIKLAEELASCSNGSPKFIVIEREIKKHIARDQSKAARSNILLGAGIAGIFTILGTVIGGVLKTCPSYQQVALSPATQKFENAHRPASSDKFNSVNVRIQSDVNTPISSVGQASPSAAAKNR